MSVFTIRVNLVAFHKDKRRTSWEIKKKKHSQQFHSWTFTPMKVANFFRTIFYDETLLSKYLKRKSVKVFPPKLKWNLFAVLSSVLLYHSKYERANHLNVTSNAVRSSHIMAHFKSTHQAVVWEHVSHSFNIFTQHYIPFTYSTSHTSFKHYP